MSEKLYSEEFERYLLGCMLIDNSIIDDVNLIVKKEHFIVTKHKLFFEKILKTYEENNACDIIMLSNNIPAMYTAEIAELTSLTSTSANFEYYAKQIQSMYKARELKAFSGELATNISARNIDELLYKADDFITTCMSDNTKAKAVDGKEMTLRTIERIQARAKNPGKLSGIDTGYQRLNELTDGFQDGNLIAVGARSSLGKSALADQLAVNIASKGVPTVSFSLEMTAEEIGERRAAVLSGVPIKRMRSGLLSAAQCQRINTSFAQIFDYGENLIMYDSDSVSCDFSDIFSKIRIHAKRGGKVFFIDHIGLIEVPEMAGCPEWERISYMTKRFKQLANKLKIVIVIVCQLGRDAEGKDPQLNQIRGSGSIEQDCNTVILIHRERQKADEVSIPTKVKVLKCRGGACGDIDFNFYPATTRFEEVIEDKSQFQVVEKKESKVEEAQALF